MAASQTPARDAVLVKYLNEAYGKEKQLETVLQAQIRLANRAQLKKGLQDHLKVTKNQARELQKRIKELGGKAEANIDLPGPDVVGQAAGAAASIANKAIAAGKGPIQALRGTSGADNELRNVRDCLWNEAEEIAHYNVIEAAAEALDDKVTAKLARTFRREEERMQTLLERQIAPLIKAVVKEEVPAAERNGGTSSRRSGSSARRSSTSKPAARKSTARKSTARKSTARKSATGTTAARKTSARKPAARKPAARSSS